MLIKDQLKPRTHYIVDHPDCGLIVCRTGALMNPQGYIVTWGTQSCGFSDDLVMVTETDLQAQAIKAGHFARAQR